MSLPTEHCGEGTTRVATAPPRAPCVLGTTFARADIAAEPDARRVDACMSLAVAPCCLMDACVFVLGFEMRATSPTEAPSVLYTKRT